MDEITKQTLPADLPTRFRTAIILAVIILACIFFATVSTAGISLLGLLGVIAVGICVYEFSRLARIHSTFRFAAYVVSMMIGPLVAGWQVVLHPTVPAFAKSFALLLSYLGAMAVVVIEGRRDLSRSKDVLVDLSLGWPLIAAGGTSLILVAQHPHILLWLLLVVCFGDIAAYFVGRRVGGPKLAPAISPGKTVSGSVGGIVVSVFVGVLAGSLLGSLNESLPLVAALAVGIAAQLGDLAKSIFKRLHGVKDLGSMFPGHGGMVDRLDGTLAGALALTPVLYAFTVGL